MKMTSPLIKEIAEKAGFILWENEDWNPGDVIDWSTRYDDELAKFAELIVKECASACLHDDWEDPRWGRFYAKKIKEHFGVEE